MTTEEIAPSRYWQALKNTTPPLADGEPFNWSAAAPRQKTIFDKLSDGILSGQLGLSVLSVAAVFACIPFRTPSVLLSGLVLAPILSWFLSSLLSRSRALRLGRFALLALSLLWVVPAGLVGPVNVLHDKELLVADQLLSWRSLGFGALLLALVLLVMAEVRRRSPWYDPQPAPGWRISLGGLIVGLPLLGYFALLAYSQPSAEAEAWEAAVLRAQPGLEFHRDRSGPQGRNWGLLEFESRPIDGWGTGPVPTRARSEVAQNLERRALKLLDGVPLRSLGFSDLYEARVVLERLARYPEMLAQPESIVQALLELQAEEASPFHFSEALSRLVHYRLESGEPEQIVATIQMLHELEKSCPDRVQELDRRWYLSHSERQFREPFILGPLGPYSPRVLLRNEARNKRIEGWVRVRPYMRRGLSWDHLQRWFDEGALPSEDAKAVARMSKHGIHLTRQDLLRPRLEGYRLVLELRRYQLQHNALPHGLADIPGSEWRSGRWLWEKEAECRVLLDTWAQRRVEKDWRWTFQ